MSRKFLLASLGFCKDQGHPREVSITGIQEETGNYCDQLSSRNYQEDNIFAYNRDPIPDVGNASEAT